MGPCPGADSAAAAAADCSPNGPYRAELSESFLFNARSFYLFVGTSTYIFEGNAALVVPLQSAVVERDKARFPPLFVRTLACIIAVYIAFGLLNWLAYGDRTEVRSQTGR